MTITKVVELVGESTDNWRDAAKNAVAEANKTIDGITGVEILNLTADVQDGEIVEYKANVQVAFPVKESRK
ncbi:MULTISPECIES: dodecin family protein [unclassified Candidatus Frackibacter]|uniref:dodecin family protein n=1 Tax=unclassified Candidatus Frackibacter TaxID=2648818 RepID=UPI00079AFD7F|nr:MULTISPECIES: dodecin family protein [unclassified Candidatus Frackibacter]KXS43671.1 MAG: hypothetical protein AWU54_962 [Candidatus Frackibacter sp. T328-2]SDC01839.1 hypothetical protein SAMN04515661_101301 [Candidatus Frackibacter sp. WG11]SEM33031.1 hypothetical protein SAMN04488698_101301 [Candidatus Frackibacter sp. WG12]SFL38027.1 hypothetical protein SAMN04488699_101300 [Candidatus Frackibacter sp. WG13]